MSPSKAFGKDLGVLINRAILNDGALKIFEALVNSELVYEEVDLTIERPAPHVFVEIIEIGILVVWLKEWLRFESLREELYQRALPGAHVPGDRNVARLFRLNSYGGHPHSVYFHPVQSGPGQGGFAVGTSFLE